RLCPAYPWVYSEVLFVLLERSYCPLSFAEICYRSLVLLSLLLSRQDAAYGIRPEVFVVVCFCPLHAQIVGVLFALCRSQLPFVVSVATSIATCNFAVIIGLKERTLQCDTCRREGASMFSEV